MDILICDTMPFRTDGGGDILHGNKCGESDKGKKNYI